MAAATTSATSVRLTAAIDQVIAELDSIPGIKPEQECALVEFLGGKDVLAVLPTRAE